MCMLYFNIDKLFIESIKHISYNQLMLIIAEPALISASDPEPYPVLLQVLFLTITEYQVPDLVFITVRQGNCWSVIS